MDMTETPVETDPDKDANPPVPQGQVTEFVARIAEALPPAYDIDPLAGLIVKSARSGETIPICQLLCVERLERGTETIPARLIISHLTETGTIAELAIPAADLGRGSPAGIAILRSSGIRILVRDTVFANFLLLWQPQTVDPVVIRPGWIASHSPAFALADGRVIVADDHEHACGLVAPRMRIEPQALAAWQRDVATQLTGNPLALTMVCASLAGPLLGWMQTHTYIVNLAGRTSSAKSTALAIAHRVWTAEPMHHWQMSRAALDDACLAANATCLALDELPDTGNRAIADMIFALANETRRGARPAAGQNAEGRSWRLVGLSTSEWPFFAQVVAEARKTQGAIFIDNLHLPIRQGAFVRLIDIGGTGTTIWRDQHGAQTRGTFLRRLEQASEQHAGIAGPAFVAALLRARAGDATRWSNTHVQRMTRMATALGIDPDRDQGAQMRVVGHFASIAIAGGMAARLGILPQSPEEVQAAVMHAADSWARIRQVGHYAQAADPLSILRTWALPRIGKSLREVDETRRVVGKTVWARDGWYNADYYFLRLKALKDLVPEGQSFAGFREGLEMRGALVRGGTAESQQIRMSVTVEGGTRVYQIARAVVDLDREDVDGAD